MKFYFLICFLFSCAVSNAQLKQVPFLRQASNPKKNLALGTQSATPAISLPFWDDFSFSPSVGVPNETLWQFGTSVFVNDGLAINPPTLKVASFDGIDSVGVPYSLTQQYAKGIADRLISQPIRMDEPTPAEQNSVFIYFYYQYQGNGEPPDPNDEFSLWFKKKDTTWIKVWSVQYDTLKDKTKFVPVKLFVKDVCDSCFTSNFQFKFQNYARLSGPFDNWNLDYVYISNGKSQYSPVHADFPDRAIATPLTSIFQNYRSIPVKHLLSKGDSLSVAPSLVVTNQRTDQTHATGSQPSNLGVWSYVGYRVDKSTFNYSKRKDSVKFDLFSGEPLTASLASLHSFDTLTVDSLKGKIDSLGLRLRMILTSGDNNEKTKVINGKTGDYDSVAYEGINFRLNDTLRYTFKFTNYYAYDDGEAEYGVTLTNPGNSLAYQFDMMYRYADTLVAVDIYFPHMGDESDQLIQLIVFGDQILNTATTNPIILTQQNLTVKRTENNQFIRVPLEEAVVVSNKFFIGYKQNTAAYIGVGFDKNSDSGDKIFANLGNGWEPSGLHGNMMFRPVFGNPTTAKGPVTGVEEKKIFAYPNPNHGVFHLPQGVQGLQVMDIAGRAVSFAREDFFESTQVTLHNANAGIYLARYFNGKTWQTEKIMVLP